MTFDSSVNDALNKKLYSIWHENFAVITVPSVSTIDFSFFFFYVLVALTTGQGYLKARGKYARRIQRNAARAGLCDWEVKCLDLVSLRVYGKL